MLLEREEPLRALALRYAEAAAGNGSLVLIAGEAGAGKTSLVRAFVESLDRSALVLSGACDPLSTPRPLSPLQDFAADPESGLGDLRPGDTEPYELFAEVLDRLRNTIRPIVMVIEDVHWADEGTLDLIRFLGRRVADTNAVVTCTYRHDEVDRTHPFRTVLGQVGSLSTTHTVEVSPLSQRAVEQLTGDTGIDAYDLHERTGGNAFFVTESIAAGGRMPRTVQDAVLARLASLDPEVRAAVEAVSVAPRDLAIDRLARLTDSEARTVDAAASSGVLVADGPRLRFRHDIARSAVEAALPPARRLALHRRMIAILEDDGEHDIARLAHHAVGTANPALILRYAIPAGRDAIARGARREAIAFFSAALRHSDLIEPPLAADLLSTLGEQQSLVGDFVGARESLTSAVETYQRIGDLEGQAAAMVLLQGPVWVLDGTEAGRAVTARAHSLLQDRDPSEALGKVLTRISHNHMIARQREPGRQAAIRAADVATVVNSEEVAWRADALRGTIELVMGDSAVGAEMLETSVKEAERMSSRKLQAWSLGMLGSGAGEARMYPTAIHALNRAIAIGQASDDDYEVAYNRAWLGRIAFEQGRWDEAAEFAEATIRGFGVVAEHLLTAQCVLGRLRIRRGDPGGLPLLQRLADSGDDYLLQYVWNAYCGVAEHAWLDGKPEVAVPLLSGAFERAMSSDSPWARGEIGFWMWRLGEIERPPKGAAEPFALQIAGEWIEAAQLWHELGCPYEEAMALADGDETAMRRSLVLLDRLAASPAAHRVRGQLRELGARGIPRGPMKATRANPEGLTPRQLEVLESMALGLSNGEIADKLFLSKRTVENHVSAVLMKLGVDTRSKAVAVAVQRSIIEM